MDRQQPKACHFRQLPGWAWVLRQSAKIQNLRKEITKRDLDVDIQVDGGITTSNVHVVLEAGANVVVAGSAVFKNDIGENVKAFLEKMK